MSAAHQLHHSLLTEVDHLLGHARADALVATGGEARTVTDPVAREHFEIGFAAGRLKTLEDIRTLLHSERPDP